jgi:peptidoglycan/LPS O-acetylase OafA/YrhL
MGDPIVMRGPSVGIHAASGSPFGFIDLLKALSTQLIVLHHLAFYGPMSDHVQPLLPGLMDWLSSQARLAVQVFLVIGGFLAAKSLSTHLHSGYVEAVSMILRRYLKLAPPFIAATLLAVGISALVSVWMTHNSVSAPPGLLQLAAHALFLHSVLDYESLWAGAWYVAIDFQLYALLTLMFWFSARASSRHPVPWLIPAMVVIGMSASLLYFNRDAAWDVWAPYFFGSYGLGILAWWASDKHRLPVVRLLLLAAIVLPTLLALGIDFRSRIAVALSIACALAWAGRRQLCAPGRWSNLVGRLGRESYSIFLVHFPVCLLVNAIVIRLVPAEPLFQAAGMLFAWTASLAAGSAFHRWIEIPLGRISWSAVQARFLKPGKQCPGERVHE